MFSHFGVGLVLTITVVVGAVVSRESNGSETDVTLPEPRIVMMGATGAGKSSLGNVLLGGPPECNDDQEPQPLNCWFGVCSSASSCTKGTHYGWGKFVGVGDNSTVIDTPGFGDSDNDDNILITEMVDALKNSIKTANTFLVTFNGENERFDTLIQQMLREVEALFGTGFWDHVVLEATHWSFDADEVDDRGPNAEENWCESMNTEIQKNFVHVTQNFSCVFIDSWARKGRHVNDTDEQEAFQRETQKLWDLTKQFGPFEFKTLEDVLGDLYQCREERDCLDGVIAGDLKTMKDDMTALWTHVSEDENMLEAHALRMDSIEETDTKQEGKLSEHSLRMDGIDGQIAGLRTDVEGLTMAPIGTIVAWSPKPNKDFTGDQEDLPDGWVKCDGKPIPEGIWKGKVTPDLNSDGHFLRGAAHYGDVLEEQAGQVEKHIHGYTEHAHTHTYDTAHSHTYEEHAHTHSYIDRVYKGDYPNSCSLYPHDHDGGPWTSYASEAIKSGGDDDYICKATFTTGSAGSGSHNTGSSGSSNIATGSAGSGSYNTAETGSDETVPINVKVIFIMKIK